jgi:fructosamine-3-kinase
MLKIAMEMSDKIESITGKRPIRLQPLSGGMIGDVYRVDLSGSDRLVAKISGSTEATLDKEGFMLRYLADHSKLPVPHVIYADSNLLLMTHIEGDSRITDSCQIHAAELLAELHGVRASQYGFERDTLIGALHQPNPQNDTWIDFFRENRLLYMAHEALNEGRIPDRMMMRIAKFASDLSDYLHEPEHPSLIHGDMWTTNILCNAGRVVGVIDPAIYYAHPEIELGFSMLFKTFGTPFLEHYGALRAIDPGFLETRRDIYNLYPLLVHVRLFGGGYIHSVDVILKRFGY